MTRRSRSRKEQHRIESLVNAQPKRPDPDEVVSRHQYQRDPHSGAGNCWCGRHEGHRMHQWSDPRDRPR
jgi:hypothetical protein